MTIGLVGYGHFAGTVGACLAGDAKSIVQYDETPHLLRASQRLADQEAGYADLVKGADWTTADDPADLARCALIWIAYDVPLDDEGAPVVDEILARIVRLHATVAVAIPFIVSCQWPVGTLARLEAQCPGRTFCYVLENVRVGQAISDFLHQASVIAGVRDAHDRALIDLVEALLFHFAACIHWMSPESAEMSKHTINAFMALQIAFANEIAAISATVHADAADVAAALMSDRRVSDHAPLKPGKPFGGGSLKRDVRVLNALALAHADTTPILAAILPSNDSHGMTT